MARCYKMSMENSSRQASAGLSDRAPQYKRRGIGDNVIMRRWKTSAGYRAVQFEIVKKVTAKISMVISTT
jgi:hypothetical protein